MDVRMSLCRRHTRYNAIDMKKKDEFFTAIQTDVNAIDDL